MPNESSQLIDCDVGHNAKISLAAVYSLMCLFGTIWNLLVVYLVVTLRNFGRLAMRSLWTAVGVRILDAARGGGNLFWKPFPGWVPSLQRCTLIPRHHCLSSLPFPDRRQPIRVDYQITSDLSVHLPKKTHRMDDKRVVAFGAGIYFTLDHIFTLPTGRMLISPGFRSITAQRREAHFLWPICSWYPGVDYYWSDNGCSVLLFKNLSKGADQCEEGQHITFSYSK